MAEQRRGIERLRWLEEDDPDTVPYPSNAPIYYPRWVTHSDKQVEIEVAYALIEELHDALARLDHPMIVVTHPPTGSE